MTSNKDIDIHNEQRVIDLINDLRADVDKLDQAVELTMRTLEIMLKTFANLYKPKK